MLTIDMQAMVNTLGKFIAQERSSEAKIRLHLAEYDEDSVEQLVTYLRTTTAMTHGMMLDLGGIGAEIEHAVLEGGMGAIFICGLAIGQQKHRLTDDERSRVVNALRAWAGVRQQTADGGELRDLADRIESEWSS